jgi:hypothetical protein
MPRHEGVPADDVLLVLLLEHRDLPAHLPEAALGQLSSVPPPDGVSSKVTSSELPSTAGSPGGMRPAEGEHSAAARRDHDGHRDDVGSGIVTVGPHQLPGGAGRRSTSDSAYHHSRTCSGLLITSNTTSGRGVDVDLALDAGVLHGVSSVGFATIWLRMRVTRSAIMRNHRLRIGFLAADGLLPTPMSRRKGTRAAISSSSSSGVA